MKMPKVIRPEIEVEYKGFFGFCAPYMLYALLGLNERKYLVWQENTM